MHTILVLLGVRTLLLTLFGLCVGTLLSVFRLRSARIVSTCWGLVLAVGVFGATIPVGIQWEVSNKSEATSGRTDFSDQETDGVFRIETEKLSEGAPASS